MDSRNALDFDNTEHMATLLFDQVLQYDNYKQLNIDINSQTYEKINALADYMRSIVNQAHELASRPPALDQIGRYEGEILKLFSSDQNNPLLSPLIPDKLIARRRIQELFASVKDYVGHRESDSLEYRDVAYA